MEIHKVKSWSYLFHAIASGKKKHDIRDMRDRSYKVGDRLLLQEYNQAIGVYTGKEVECEITYITDRSTPCAFSGSVLDRRYGILSLQLKA